MSKLNFTPKINSFFSENDTSDIDFCNLLHEKLSFVRGKTVLEVGPMRGFFTDMILSHEPSSLTLVEGDLDHMVKYLRQDYANYKNVEVIHDDIFFYIDKNIKKFDVVILFGVIYHFHSTFWLLELIKNFIDPEYICIDDVFSKMEPSVRIENDGKMAQRQTRLGWHSTQLNVILPFNSIKTGLSNLGYEMIDFINPSPDLKYKKDFYVSFYKNQNLNK